MKENKPKRPKKRLLYSFLKHTVGLIFRAKFHPKYKGLDNVPEHGAYIIASNHREALDPIMISLGVKRQIAYMAKEELFSKKIVSWFLRKLGAFPISRGKADMGAIKHFENVIEEGGIVGIFIEGTRSKDDQFLPPKNGVSLIAYNTNTPVIPVCITQIGKYRMVHIGEPLSLTDMGFENGGAREFRNASRIIMDHIKVLREQDLSE